MKDVFGVFDAAVVLNRDSDTERMHRIARRLDTLNIPFERFSAKLPDPQMQPIEGERIAPGAYACAQSHAALLRMIQDRAHQRVLILEDDVVFRDDTNECMAKITPSLETLQWDVFYLGLHLRHGYGRLTEHIGRVGAAFHAHAYVVTKSAIPRLLRFIDHVLANPVTTFDSFDDPTLIKLYSIPILAVQEPNTSLTINEQIDRLPQYFATFDGEEYESHCKEVQTWSSNWRDILGFMKDLGPARRAWEGGSLETAARYFAAALDGWPAIKNMLLVEDQFEPTMHRLAAISQMDVSGQFEACRKMADILGRRFGHYL
jgi:GR25 family glycosyltransferase involved in LPS biosynthesis